MLAVALIFAAGFANRAHADLVQNGTFTQTVLGKPGGFICASGSTCTSNITDWGSACATNATCGNSSTVASLLFPGTNGSAFNGGIGMDSMTDTPASGNMIAIDGDSTYTAPLFQTINGLTAGTSYVLQFLQAAGQQAGSGGPTTEQWEVSLGSQTQDSSLMNNPSGGFTAWNAQTMVFTATSSSELLNFMALGTPQGVPPVVLLSDVSLTAAPEPASLVLIGSGVVAVWAARKRARRTSPRS